MALHVRTQIRQDLADSLSGMVTPTAVFMERRRRIGAEDMPCVVVSLTDSEVDTPQMTMGTPYMVETRETLAVELHADGDDGLSCVETIDIMETELEGVMESSITLGGLVDFVEPSGSRLEFSSDTERVQAVRIVEYTITWRHQFGTPDLPES